MRITSVLLWSVIQEILYTCNTCLLPIDLQRAQKIAIKEASQDRDIKQILICEIYWGQCLLVQLDYSDVNIIYRRFRHVLAAVERTMWCKDSGIEHTWQVFASIICTCRARGGRWDCKRKKNCSQLLGSLFSVPVHVKGNHSTNGRLQPKCRL